MPARLADALGLGGLKAVAFECLSPALGQTSGDLRARVRAVWGEVTDRSVSRALAWLVASGLATRTGDMRDGIYYFSVRMPVYRPTREDMVTPPW